MKALSTKGLGFCHQCTEKALTSGQHDLTYVLKNSVWLLYGRDSVGRSEYRLARKEPTVVG